MSKKADALYVFTDLNKKTVSKIINALDESIIEDQHRSPKLETLKNMGLTTSQSQDIMECFANFYIGLKHPDKIKKLINSKTNINEDTKQLINETFNKIIKKGNKTKIAIASKAVVLDDFGHEHLGRLGVEAEFRPVVIDGKLSKMVLAVVVEGYTHDDKHNRATTINFQISLAGFEELVNNLNMELQQIKSTAKMLQTKIGENIVSI